MVPRRQYEALRAEYADLPAYPIDEASVKLPAGWLIDRAGLRGAGNDRAGTYARQALVMVNRGGASGQDILQFSEQVQRTVRERFGVVLEREVQLVGR